MTLPQKRTEDRKREGREGEETGTKGDEGSRQEREGRYFIVIVIREGI